MSYPSHVISYRQVQKQNPRLLSTNRSPTSDRGLINSGKSHKDAGVQYIHLQLFTYCENLRWNTKDNYLSIYRTKANQKFQHSIVKLRITNWTNWHLENIAPTAFTSVTSPKRKRRKNPLCNRSKKLKVNLWEGRSENRALILIRGSTKTWK